MIKKWFSQLISTKKESIPFQQRRLLIFGLGRTGSTVLEDLLQSTGYFKAHGELFNPSEPLQNDPVQYFIEKANQCGDKHFISHVKLYEMESVDQSGMSKRDFLEALLGHGWQIIYLTRTNKLKHNLSSYRAHETSIFHTEKVLPPVAMTIDCFKFKHGVKHLISWGNEERELLNGLPYLEIEYERHLENGLSHQSAVKTILDYVGLPHRIAQTKHKKVLRGDLKSLISNYDEFVEEMTLNGFGEYLS